MREKDIWTRSIILLIDIHALTREFTEPGTNDISRQMRQTAVSVPLNIAEGSGMQTKGERQHFFSLAQDSLCDLEIQISNSKRLEFVRDTRALDDQIAVIWRMLEIIQQKMSRDLVVG